MSLLTACGAAIRPLPSGEPPFSAEQIRAATPEGRRYRYRIEQPGKPPFIQLMEFVKVDARGATLRQRSMADQGHAALRPRPGADPDPKADPNAAGAPTDAEVRSETAHAPVTWTELAEHGRRSASDPAVTFARITVPAGTYDCLRYTIKRGRVITRSWFALSLPGSPILQEVLRDGRRTFRMLLLDHHPSDAGDDP